MPFVTRNGKQIWVRDDQEIKQKTSRDNLGANAGTGVLADGTPQDPGGSPIVKKTTEEIAAGRAGTATDDIVSQYDTTTTSAGDVMPPRAEATIATPEDPIKTVTADASDFGTLSDRDKQVQILRKQADGQALSQEEKDWKINKFLDDQEATRDDLGLGAVDDVLAEQLAAEEARYGTEKRDLDEIREENIRKKKLELDALLRNQQTDITAAGEREKSAAGTALSFSGFGRSTFSADQQAQIQKNVNNQLQAAQAARDLEMRLFEQQLQGADDEVLQGIKNNIANLKGQIAQWEVDSALKVAELNQQNALNFEESFNNLMQTLDPTTQKKFDKDATAALGYMADEFGQPIFGEDGEKIMVNNEDPTEWGSYTDKYGNTVFYDKSDPSNTKKPGSSTVYRNSADEIASSPTSDINGLESLGEGAQYTRDDGSSGNLGENCVKWARENVPNLPYGLYNKQDKANAVAFAEEEGFGSSDMTNVQVGDAVLTKEGNVGHAAVVSGFTENGDLILAEANYVPGQVTQGRTISKNDPVLYGYISSSLQPQMSSVINPDAKNEGYNPAIATQVVVEESTPDISFSSKQKQEFDTWIKKDKLPLWVDNATEEAQFMNDFAVWEAQGGEDSGKKLGGTEARNLSDGQTAINLISDLKEIISEGRTNPIRGGFSKIPLVGNLAEQTRIDNAELKRAAQMVGKFMEGGVLRKEDEVKYGEMLPRVTDTDPIAKAKMLGVYDMLIEKLNTDISSYKAAGFNTSEFIPLVQKLETERAEFDSEKTITQQEVVDAAKGYGISVEEYSDLLRQDGYNIQ